MDTTGRRLPTLSMEARRRKGRGGANAAAFVVVALLTLLLQLCMSSDARAAHSSTLAPEDKPALIEALCGWRGMMFLGTPTPICIRIRPGINPVDGVVTLRYSQDSTQRAAISQRVALVPGRDAEVWFTVLISQSRPSFDVSLLTAKGDLIDRKNIAESFRELDAFSHWAPLADTHTAIMLDVGGNLNAEEVPPGTFGYSPGPLKLGTSLARATCEIGRADLPPDVEALRGFRAILIRESMFTTLDRPRQDALRQYARGGGLLYVIVEPAGDGWRAVFAPGREPVELGQAESLSADALVGGGWVELLRMIRLNAALSAVKPLRTVKLVPELLGRPIAARRGEQGAGWRSEGPRQAGSTKPGFIAHGPVGLGYVVLLGIDARAVNQVWQGTKDMAFRSLMLQPAPRNPGVEPNVESLELRWSDITAGKSADVWNEVLEAPFASTEDLAANVEGARTAPLVRALPGEEGDEPPAGQNEHGVAVVESRSVLQGTMMSSVAERNQSGLAATALLSVLPPLSLNHALAWAFFYLMLALAVLLSVVDFFLFRRDKRTRSYISAACWVVAACIVALLLPNMFATQAGFHVQTLRRTVLAAESANGPPLEFVRSAEALFAEQRTAWQPERLTPLIAGIPLAGDPADRETISLSLPVWNMATVSTAQGYQSQLIEPISVRRMALHAAFGLGLAQPAQQSQAQGAPSVSAEVLPAPAGVGRSADSKIIRITGLPADAMLTAAKINGRILTLPVGRVASDGSISLDLQHDRQYLPSRIYDPEATAGMILARHARIMAGYTHIAISIAPAPPVPGGNAGVLLADAKPVTQRWQEIEMTVLMPSAGPATGPTIQAPPGAKP